MQTGICLRIYLSESDSIQHTPALEAILGLCQQAGLQGVSVLRGIEGLGKHGVHSASFLELSSSLPLVIEVIDTEEKIHHALPLIQGQLPSALIATWPIQLIQKPTE
jgi:PII-like signaling protein